MEIRFVCKQVAEKRQSEEPELSRGPTSPAWHRAWVKKNPPRIHPETNSKSPWKLTETPGNSSEPTPVFQVQKC